MSLAMTSIGCAVFFLGVLITRRLKSMQYNKLLETRLYSFADKTNKPVQSVVSVANRTPRTWLTMSWWENIFASNVANAGWLSAAKRMIDLANFGQKADSIILAILILFCIPLIGSVVFDFNLLYMFPVSVTLSLLPVLFIIFKANANRRKFIEQLPQAIDLMVSVLRSGFSVPQSVKTVADELPYPCGDEFTQILQRMNFGQTLSQAFLYSCDKFRCYELDLIRRAVGIQAEIGGSLADLIDKTNDTLKNRLKLVRKVGALTAQSKLTALIVGFLPFVMGIVLNTLKPGYLYPLFESSFGKTLLTVALVLQVLGLIIMKKLSTVRI